MKITITADDIDNGRAYRADSCPAALALKRRTGNRGATVGIMLARSLGASWRTSRSLQRWIEAFDNSRAVKPASFILRECATA